MADAKDGTDDIIQEPPSVHPAAMSKNALKKLQRLQRYEDKKRTKYNGVSLSRRTRICEVQEEVRKLLGMVPLGDDVEATFAWDEAVGTAMLDRFSVNSRYVELVDSYGRDPAHGLDMLRAVMVRPAKYQEKMLPQEYSLLNKLWCIFGGNMQGTGIIDIGAGNGCLAVLAACLFGSTVVILDKNTPRIELCAEESLPTSIRSRVIRIEEDIDNLDIDRLENLFQEHGVTRTAVMAKHLCGIGTDVAIEFVSRMPTRPVGAVMATCCGHKTDIDRYTQLYTSDLASAAHSQSFLKLCTSHASWRTIPGSLEVEKRYAEAFEDILQAPRISRLQKLFGSCAESLFVPVSQSPQNRCLVAPVSPSQVAEDFVSFIARRIQEINDILPLDCKPVGLTSSRYDYDGM